MKNTLKNTVVIMALAAVTQFPSAYAATEASHNPTGTGSPTSGPAHQSSASGNASTATDLKMWNEESRYWQDNYKTRPYYSSSRSYNDYEPAYHYGVDLYNRHPSKRYEDLSQSDLDRGWTQARGNSNMNWNDAQAATRDAYEHMARSRANPGNGNSNTN